MDLKDKIINILWGIAALHGADLLDNADAIAQRIETMVRDHFLDDIAWYTNEVSWHVERGDDLEVDLLIEQNRMVKFPVPGRGSFETNVIKRKKRSNFKNEK